MFKLLDWHHAVINFVHKHEDIVGEEAMQRLSQYERNKRSSIRVSFPQGVGHTSLAAYLASCYPCILVYDDIDHYKTLDYYAKEWIKDDSREFVFHENTVCVSVFHIFHDIMTQSQPTYHSESLKKLRIKFLDETNNLSTNGRMVVIDNAQRVYETHPEVFDWFYRIADGPIVALG